MPELGPAICLREGLRAPLAGAGPPPRRLHVTRSRGYAAGAGGELRRDSQLTENFKMLAKFGDKVVEGAAASTLPIEPVIE